MSVATRIFDILKDVYAQLDLRATTVYVDQEIAAHSGSMTAQQILDSLKTVDGAGSGLDADKLAGVASTGYALSGHTHSAATQTVPGFMAAADKTKLDGIESGATADMTAAELLTAIKTVDGAGSGLDADLLDGYNTGNNSGNIPISNGNLNTNLNAEKVGGYTVASLLSAMYPVGSIYMSISPVNPAGLFGGTWESLPDKFLVGAGTTFGAGSSGGAMTHIHSIAAHLHGLAAGFAMISMYTGYNYIKRIAVAAWTDNQKTTGTYSASATSNSYGAALGGTTDNNAAQNTSDVSHLPPYLAVYMWKRTA